MKIAFIQRAWFENIGIMSLSAVLKKNGHQAEVFIAAAERKLAAQVGASKPDIACFSCTSAEYSWAIKTAEKLKKSALACTVFGGPGPTFFPEIIGCPQVDFVCRGEGEQALLELVEHVNKKNGYEHIKNLVYKDNGRIVYNGLRPLITDLDCLPLPDRSIYDKYEDFQEHPTKHFIASRGCIFNCSYCYNHQSGKLFPDAGALPRKRSPEHIISEIEYAKERYPLRTVFFDDDCFMFEGSWASLLLKTYRQRIKLPFICNVHASLVNDDVAAMLKEAGCFRVSMGIETGDESLRQGLLNKPVSNAQIIKAASSLKKYGIKLLSNNMLGIPGETTEQAFETIRLNKAVKADYPWCSILQPYPGTEIEKASVEKGLIDPSVSRRFFPTFFKTSPLAQKNMNELINLQKLFFLSVKFPVFYPALKVMIKLPLRFLYNIVFLATFAYRYKSCNRLTCKEMVKFGIRNLSLYLNN